MLSANISRSSPCPRIPKYLHHKMLDMTWKNTHSAQKYNYSCGLQAKCYFFFLMEKIHKDQFFKLQWELQRMKQTQKASLTNSMDCLLQLEPVVSRKLHRLNFDDKLFTMLSRTCSLLQC